MKWKLVFLTILCLHFIPLVSAHNITVPTNAYFGFGTDCYIKFDTQQTFDAVKRKGTYWYFNDYGFQVQNANMTITNFFTNNKLVFVTDAPSGITSTTRIYVGNKGKPYQIVVDGKQYPIRYDAATRILTIQISHSSPSKVVVNWSTGLFPTELVNYYWTIFQASFVLFAFSILVGIGAVILGRGGSLLELTGLAIAIILAAIIVLLFFSIITTL